MQSENTTGISRAISAAGGQKALADLVGCTQQNISFWKRQGYAPVLRAVEIEQVTGVARVDLINPRIWEVVAPVTA